MSSDSSFLKSVVAVGAAVVLWRLRHALASMTLAQLRALYSEAYGPRQFGLDVSVATERSPILSNRGQGAPINDWESPCPTESTDLPIPEEREGSAAAVIASSEPSPAPRTAAAVPESAAPATVSSEAERPPDGEPAPDIPGPVLEALTAALVAVDSAAALHAQAGAVQQAARLLVGTLLQSLAEAAAEMGAPEAARQATIEAFKSAETAATELEARLGSLLGEARTFLEALREELSENERPAAEVSESPGAMTPTGEFGAPEISLDTELVSHEAETAGVGAELRNELDSYTVLAQAEEVASSAEGQLSDDASHAPASAWSRLDMQVSRFTRFADLNGYRDALAALPGVRDVKIRRVHKGVLFLSVDYEGIVPLTERLQDIREHPARRVSMAGDTIQVAVTDEDEE